MKLFNVGQVLLLVTWWQHVPCSLAEGLRGEMKAKEEIQKIRAVAEEQTIVVENNLVAVNDTSAQDIGMNVSDKG